MQNRNQSWNREGKHPNRKFFKTQPKNLTEAREKIVFSVMNETFMGITISYKLMNDQYRQLIKTAQGTWDPTYKIWKFPRTNYTFLRTEMPLVNPEVIFEDPPDLVDRAVREQNEVLTIKKQKLTITYDKKDVLRNIKQNPLFHKLYPFQRESLSLSVKKYGRLLIADEMGVGKTVQSLACALQFREEWPLLIICPSALKFIWLSEIEKWLVANGLVYKEQIQILSKGNNMIRFNDIKILICSYDIAAKLTDHFNGFKVVITDEAHYLKNSGAQRSLNLVPFLSSRKRVFLLTGTPALAKPRQLFNLASIIRPDVFYDIKQFGDRYCCLTRNPWSGSMQYEGSRNSSELYFILKNKIMIRRLKSEVLEDLPPKQRQTISLQTDKQIVKQIRELLKQNQIDVQKHDGNTEKAIQQLLVSSFRQSSGELDAKQKNNSRCSLNKCFQLTGMAKINSVKQYIRQLMENDIKVLIFAHHRAVLDQLESFTKDVLKIQYIRIDGSGQQHARQKSVERFQDNVDVRMALLSITAAGVGYTLTSASTVIFAQLHWTPAMMIQAEDRIHRIGQKVSCNIHYLLGQNTLDNLLYKILQKKVRTVGQVLDGKVVDLQVQKVQKGNIGHYAKDSKHQSTKITGPSSSKVSKITDYFCPKSEFSEFSDDIQQQDQIDRLIRKKRAQLQESRKKQSDCPNTQLIRLKKTDQKKAQQNGIYQQEVQFDI